MGSEPQDPGGADSGLWIGLLADMDSGSGTGFWAGADPGSRAGLWSGRGSRLRDEALGRAQIPATDGVLEQAQIPAPGQDFGTARLSRLQGRLWDSAPIPARSVKIRLVSLDYWA